MVDESPRARARSILEAAYCGDGQKFIKVHTVGSSLSITVGTPPLKDMAGERFQIGGRQATWVEAGIRKQEIEPGTGYHIPEGALAVLCGRFRGDALNQARSTVRADCLKDWLLAINSEGHAKIPSLSSLVA